MSPASRQHQAREWLLSSQGLGRPYVKLCGMSREEDIRAVAQARPDMCGFIVNFPPIAPKRFNGAFGGIVQTAGRRGCQGGSVHGN